MFRFAVRWAAIGFATFAPSLALAGASECSTGSQAPLELRDWSITIQDNDFSSFAEASINVLNSTEKDIVALDGNIQFFDPLMRFVISLKLPEIQSIRAADIVDVGGVYASDKLESLAPVDPNLITVIVCTIQAAYADGSTETFD